MKFLSEMPYLDEPILRELVRNPGLKHVKLACASKTWNVEYSHQCLNLLHINGIRLRDYFVACEVYPKTKNVHFEQLKSVVGCEWNEMLFFDDCTWKNNFEDVLHVSQGQVACLRTPKGMTYEVFRQGLDRFGISTISLTPSSSDTDLEGS